MEATWRKAPLADASGALSALGAQVLGQELVDERLAVVTLLGPRSTRAARVELLAKLLEPHGAAAESATAEENTLMLLASVSCSEEDYCVLVLDMDTPENGQASCGLDGLAGAVCALSSLVVSCHDDLGSPASLLPTLPAFRTLFEALVEDFAAMEVYELLPKMLTLDFSPSRSLSTVADQTQSQDVEGLAGLVQFKRGGVLYPRSVAQMGFPAFVGSHAGVKRLFGCELSGEMLLFLLQKLSRQALDGERAVAFGDALEFGEAWDDFVEEKCSVLAEDALNTYVDCIHPSVLEVPPMELDAFTQLHEEIRRLSMDVYHAADKFKSARRRTVRSKLKADITAHFETELKTLRDASRKFCEQVRRSLWTELSGCAMQSEDGHRFAAMLNAIQAFDEQYNERARGPEKAAVLRGFYQKEAIEAFRQLEGVVTQQLSESRLQELRLRLEKDFEDRKEALVAHFKQQEAQLRAGMERDRQMTQKMHQAKASRVKIDGGEVKRLRDELNESKRLNAELDEQLIVLRHSQQDTANQKAVLAGKVKELEATVDHEVASRAELVDTLALTVKSAEEKEKMLTDQITELQVEVGEKTFRVEGELQELQYQLRKTNEEKEELQKKLNEFFLKVSALPDALQQHLFCSDTEGQVDFADALTSYMS